MNAVTLPRLPIVILAAGFSTRLGAPKALARVHGISLLRRSLRLVANLSSGKVMVISPPNYARYRIEACGQEVVFVANPQRGGGLSSSVRRAIAQARYSPALLLLPVDLVIFQRRELTRLLSRWRASPRRVVARRVGHAGGTPLILPRWLYIQARRIAGDRGLREWLGALPAQHRVLMDLPSAEWDVDTPADLRRARQRMRRTSFSL